MTNYIDQFENPQFPFHKRETERLIAKFETDATVADGVVRWTSNGSVPPQDILELWQHVGKPFDAAKSAAVRDEETSAFLADYRKRMANHQHTPEELAEMRAAFGPGATVVNVITGKKTTL